MLSKWSYGSKSTTSYGEIDFKGNDLSEEIQPSNPSIVSPMICSRGNSEKIYIKAKLLFLLGDMAACFTRIGLYIEFARKVKKKNAHFCFKRDCGL